MATEASPQLLYFVTPCLCQTFTRYPCPLSHVSLSPSELYTGSFALVQRCNPLVSHAAEKQNCTEILGDTFIYIRMWLETSKSST